MSRPCETHSIGRLARLARAFLLLSLLSTACAADTNGWELVWVDEFEGGALDQAKWEFEVNGRGGGNGELQYYTTNNAVVRNGHLVIEARKERYTGPDGTRGFTSSRLRTRLKGDWQYGRLDIRAKLPAGRGLWPAIWMLPTDNAYGGWPHSGEIDIVELVGHEPNRVHGTLHFSKPDGRHTFQGKPFTLTHGDFSQDFHVFRLEWESGVVRWYVDEQLFQTQTNWTAKAGKVPAPFDQRFHLLLNLAVGGQWPGPPDANTKFPQAMVVDYVRVYRRK